MLVVGFCYLVGVCVVGGCLYALRVVVLVWWLLLVEFVLCCCDCVLFNIVVLGGLVWCFG